MWHQFKTKCNQIPKPIAILGLVCGLIAIVLVLLALWFTFVPQKPPPLRDASSRALATGNQETHLADPATNHPALPQAQVNPEDPLLSLSQPQAKAIQAEALRQKALNQVASVSDAPAVLTPDEVAFVEAQMASEQVEAKDVVFALSRDRAKRPPKFMQKHAKPKPSKAAPAVFAKTAQPGYQRLGFKPKPAIYPMGRSLEARLLSDIVAIKGLATVALVEVFAPSGRSLGVSIVNANLSPKGKAAVNLEGNLIVDGENRAIRGNFLAFSPNGQVGILGQTKTYWLRHVGMTLYRTALGVLPLRLADKDNTLAGIIGAQAGTAILKDLAGDVQRAPDRQTFIPRGYRFQIVFTTPARLPDDETDLFDPSRPDFARAARENNYLSRERERAVFELANRFRELNDARSPFNRDLSFENALANPASALGVLEEVNQ